MGKPVPVKIGTLRHLVGARTLGSKTFQYQEENRTIVIALVAASENATAQTTFLSLFVSQDIGGDSEVGL